MPSTSHPLPSASILLVEDEKVTLELLAGILAKKFSTATFYTAANGKEGLELFERHLPDIVITDINMPEMNGIQMAEKIRTIKPDTQFIVITGDARKPIPRDSADKDFDFDHFIVKPVLFRELFTTIELCFGKIARQARFQHGDLRA